MHVLGVVGPLVGVPRVAGEGGRGGRVIGIPGKGRGLVLGVPEYGDLVS